MVEQQRFIRLRQSAQALLKRKKPLLEEMVSKVHAYKHKNMDVYVLDDPTLTRDLVLIYRTDKSGAYNIIIMSYPLKLRVFKKRFNAMKKRSLNFKKRSIRVERRRHFHQKSVAIESFLKGTIRMK